MKKVFLLITFLIFSSQLFAQQTEQLPPVRGVGVVVKRNPGSGASLVLNPTPEGHLAFSITEAGDYTVNVQNLSVSATPGNGVKGVKVSLGKNPPGAIIKRAVSNEYGEVEFKNLAVSEYFIEVMESGKSELLPVRDFGAIRPTSKTNQSGTKGEVSQSDIRKGWDGTVKGNKKAMSMLMGRPSNCTDVGACHNQISPLNPNGTPAEREVAIEFSIEDNQLVGKYLSRPIAKSDIFVTSEPILIGKKYINNGKTDIIILPNNHKSDPTLGKFGGVRFLFKSK